MSTPKEKGNKYFQEKRYEDAIAEYTRAILLINSAPSPNNKKELAVLCGNRAECFIRLEQYLDALTDCQRCIEADPTNLKGHYRKGICLQKLRQFKEACSSFQEACNMDPSNAQATARLGEATKSLKKVEGLQNDILQRGQEVQYARFPVSLKFNPLKGRAVHTTRDIDEGETVLAVKGVACVLEDPLLASHCNGCFVDISEIKENPKDNLCHKCQKATFCSKCMKVPSRRVAHEEECPILQQLFSKSSNFLIENSRDQRLLFRLLLVHLREKEKKQVDVREGHTCDFLVDSFPDVMSLSFNTSQLHPMQLKAFRDCAEVAINMVSKNAKGKIDLTIEDVVSIQAAILQNAHEITDPLSSSPSGIGLFPSAAYLNHSCLPNCSFYVNNEGIICFKCVRKIKSGEELCPTYIDILRPTRERQKQLEEQYCFTCECERCEKTAENTENAENAESDDVYLEGCVCEKEGCGGLLREYQPSTADIQDQSYECDECKTRTKLGPYIALEDEVVEMYEKAKESDPPDESLIAKALLLSESKLHRFHFMRCIMRRTITDIGVKKQKWSEVVTHATELLAAYYFIFPGDTFVMGHDLAKRYYQLAKGMKETGHQKAAQTAKLVLTILGICVGSDHRVNERVKLALLPP